MSSASRGILISVQSSSAAQRVNRVFLFKRICMGSLSSLMGSYISNEFICMIRIMSIV